MITIFDHQMSYGEPLCTWSIGESVPRVIENYKILPKKISLIAVDGEELSLIQNMMEGLPQHRTEEPQIYTGDLAAQIVANILPYNLKGTRLLAYGKDGNCIMEWMVGDKIEGTNVDSILNTHVVVCNYEEISWMLTNYLNVPYHKDRSVQAWYGDMARFIVAQLPAKDGQQ